MAGRQQHWELLFHQTLRFAQYQVQRLRWRGAHGGILPDGYDAESLAAEAFLDLFLAENLKPNPDRSLSDLLYELKRLVLKHVTRLYHRKENFIFSSAEDLLPIQMTDEFLHPVELIPDDPDHHPDAVLLRTEALASFECSKSQFSSFLKSEPRLRNFFHSICNDIETPRALAGRVKLRRATVTNLRKQLRRRWRQCFRSKPSVLAYTLCQPLPQSPSSFKKSVQSQPALNQHINHRPKIISK
jgi:hypothetical protein